MNTLITVLVLVVVVLLIGMAFALRIPLGSGNAATGPVSRMGRLDGLLGTHRR